MSELRTQAIPTETENSSLSVAERDHILRVMRACKGQIGGPEGAAVRLALKRVTLNSKLKKPGIKKSDCS